MKNSKNESKIAEVPNLSILNKSHENKWVALSSDYKKILAIGEKLSDVMNAKESDKIVFKVLPQLGYAPFIA